MAAEKSNESKPKIEYTGLEGVVKVYKDLNDNSAESKKVIDALSDFFDSRMVLWIAYVERVGEFRITYGRDEVWSM